MMSAPIRGGLQLGGLLVVAALVITAVQFSLAPRITLQENRIVAQQWLRVLPPGNYDEIQPRDFIDSTELGEPRKIAVVRQHGAVVAVIIPAAASGYGGVIDLLVGVYTDGRVAGVEIVTQHETPGLGDRIEKNKSHWLDNFSGRSLRDPLPEQWQLKTEGGAFDGFTGATMTPRAVTHAVRSALEYFTAHREQLLRTEPSHE